MICLYSPKKHVDHVDEDDGNKQTRNEQYYKRRIYNTIFKYISNLKMGARGLLLTFARSSQWIRASG